MPTKVTLSNGQEGELRDHPNADGNYEVHTTSGTHIVDSMSAYSAHREASAAAAQKSVQDAQAPMEFINSMKAGYDSTGANESLQRLQGSWTTMILTLMWRAVRYYFRALVKGPLGDRLGVLAAIVIGFVMVGSSGSARGTTTDGAMLGTLILLFGGLILGPVGGYIERMIRSRNQS
ncbi:MAG: hypothetical protein KF716_21865 [Anaerolineae bacterium]|nr:hypothetical protein [Anaerolineae bacterium]